MIQSISIGDSSDDEIPKPMNFSALTRAILEDRPSTREDTAPPVDTLHAATQRGHERMDSNGSKTKSGTSPRRTLRITRSPPAPDEINRQPSPRIVYLSGSKQSSGARQTSFLSDQPYQRATSHDDLHHELITPAPGPRGRPIRSHTHSGTSTEGPASHTSSTGPTFSSGQDDIHNQHPTLDRQKSAEPKQDIARNSSATERSRPADALPSSLRVKRVPIGSGTFLRGAPVRRGVRRRHSDDEQSPIDNLGSSQEDASNLQQGLHHEEASSAIATDKKHRDETGGANHGSGTNQQGLEHAIAHARSTREVPAVRFKVPSLPPVLPSSYDQENEPPPTFKRNKSQGPYQMLGDIELASHLKDSKDKKMLIYSTTEPKSLSPRQALLPRSHNTPHRAAPPPPKMDILEAATASAGASTVKKKKPRHVVINGKTFALRGRLGKGGSSDVYRVMAENDKIFALKRVNLEDCNEETVRGYKGEIELLKRLENVDRVVRLFDWEVNEPKQSLSVLMEAGESDLNRVLSHRLHPENAKLDLSFTRHYWGEMLACVSAVHSYDIVHSDLKPANFLLVQGRLKLIDFGIANAIDVDNTVNVHRETNVGTPNYMSPESLQDSSGTNRAPGSPKLMKLGKPSDVWSLGCILYQMLYGKPPFAHIPNQWNRVMAIINPAVEITYPATGVGGAFVPSAARRTLRHCLDRDAAKRPSVDQLLDDKDAFLHPDLETEQAVPVSEEVLAHILQNVVNRCRDGKRGLPSEEEVRRYARGFMEMLGVGR